MCKLKEKREEEKENKREKECSLCGKKYKGYYHECPYMFGLEDLHLSDSSGVTTTINWSDSTDVW